MRLICVKLSENTLLESKPYEKTNHAKFMP